MFDFVNENGYELLIEFLKIKNGFFLRLKMNLKKFRVLKKGFLLFRPLGCALPVCVAGGPLTQKKPLIFLPRVRV